MHLIAWHRRTNNVKVRRAIGGCALAVGFTASVEIMVGSACAKGMDN
jgi:hypothetical protein